MEELQRIARNKRSRFIRRSRKYPSDNILNQDPMVLLENYYNRFIMPNNNPNKNFSLLVRYIDDVNPSKLGYDNKSQWRHLYIFKSDNNKVNLQEPLLLKEGMGTIPYRNYGWTNNMLLSPRQYKQFINQKYVTNLPTSMNNYPIDDVLENQYAYELVYGVDDVNNYISNYYNKEAKNNAVRQLDNYFNSRVFTFNLNNKRIDSYDRKKYNTLPMPDLLENDESFAPLKNIIQQNKEQHPYTENGAYNNSTGVFDKGYLKKFYPSETIGNFQQLKNYLKNRVILEIHLGELYDGEVFIRNKILFTCLNKNCVSVKNKARKMIANFIDKNPSETLIKFRYDPTKDNVAKKLLKEAGYTDDEITEYLNKRNSNTFGKKELKLNLKEINKHIKYLQSL